MNKEYQGVADDGASVPDRAGGPTDLSRCASQHVGAHPSRRFDPLHDPEPHPFWLVLTEQNYAIRFSWDNGNYAMDFRLFGAAESFAADSDVGVWELFDGQEGHDLAEWESAFAEIEGSVKWDGCINWHTNPECMFHGCGPRHGAELASIFDTIYAAGGWYYDFLGDPIPAMPSGVISVTENRDRDRSGSTEGESPDPQGIAQTPPAHSPLNTEDE